MKNKIFLNFRIDDYDDITGEEISQALEVSPYKIYVKGQRRPGFDMPLPLARMNRWVMASPLDEYASFEDQLNATLNIIEPKIDLFKPFCEQYRCEFACALFLYLNNGESIPSVYLGDRYNKLAEKLKVGFDIDIYVNSNDEEL